MERKPEQIHPDRWLKDLPPREEQTEGYKAEEMLACPKCGRLSPPNRLGCFYCNAELPVADTKFTKLNLRRLEIWEKGFNVIFLPDNSDFDETKVSESGAFLRLESEVLAEILDSKKPLPIARVESEREAEIIVRRLAEGGVKSFVLSDEKLQPEIVPRRLRELEFTNNKLNLILFNSGEIEAMTPEDLCLIVTGALFERKIRSIEKHNRKKENKILETAEISLDEPLIDVYNRRDAIGYRIAVKGFDFSCLGAEKQLFAAENMKRLAERLRAFAPHAKLNDDYCRLRGVLSRVWELEEKRDSKGVQKKSFGSGLNIESVTTVDNALQFIKYSRLQRHLL